MLTNGKHDLEKGFLSWPVFDIPFMVLINCCASFYWKDDKEQMINENRVNKEKLEEEEDEEEVENRRQTDESKQEVQTTVTKTDSDPNIIKCKH